MSPSSSCALPAAAVLQLLPGDPGCSRLWAAAVAPGVSVLQLRGGSGFLLVASSQGCLTAHCMHSQFFITYASMPLIKFPVLNTYSGFGFPFWTQNDTPHHSGYFSDAPHLPGFSEWLIYLTIAHTVNLTFLHSNNPKEKSALSYLYSRCDCIQKPKSSGCIFNTLPITPPQLQQLVEQLLFCFVWGGRGPAS